MNVVIYGLKNCDTCRKAMKALAGAELRDVRVDGVPDAVMASALAQFDTALVNTRSMTWRGLSDADRLEAPEVLLKAHPALMKRPLITLDDQLFLSWNNDIEAHIKALL